MKQALQQISTPIAPHIEAFKEAFQAALQSNNALLEQMVAHVNQSLGKQMRPMLVLLCAQLCGGITPATIHAAVSVELLHVASLIHDDVVDESDQRRGKPSLWARFQSKAAVLGGDFYLSAALSEAVKSNQLAIVEGIANMGKRLVDGELLQLSGSKNAIYNQAYYFKVIEAKTAELFKTCAQLGALSSPNCSEQLVEKAIEMGNAIGICFQLKDDVFDYQQGEHIGKPVGNDVQEGKMTLPLLYVYEQASESEKAIIKQAFDNKDMAYIQQLVSEKGGIDYTLEQIELYKQKALQYLQDFEDSPTRKAIEQFILLVAEREK
jgi:octaprenyl-diphosphate synthase